jgi:hypothetical protein
VIPSIAAVIGLYLAYRGIDAWRREHTGKRRIELAEETLAMFYEVSDAIGAIRNPISHAGEADEIDMMPGETEEQFQARKRASIAFIRYNQYSELFGRLRSTRYRFMAMVGQQEAQPFDNIHAEARRVLAAANSLSRLWAQDIPMDEERAERFQERIDRFEAIFWDGDEDDDQLKARVEQAVQAMEQTCRSIIKGALK